MNCKLADVQANLRKIQSLAEKKKEVDILCFPELATTGYNIGQKWVELSETIPGPSTERLCQIASEYGTYLIAGISERDATSNSIFNSAALISPEGDVVGVHRKVHLWDEERRYFTPGNDFKVFRTKIGMIGIGICYDLEFPEAARIMALGGADMIFFPSAEMKPYEKCIDTYVLSRAAENELFVCFSNRLGREGKLVFFGHSQIASPTCHVLAKARASEDFATARLDLASLSKIRREFLHLELRVPSAYVGLQAAPSSTRAIGRTMIDSENCACGT
jgi:predicted amidohydrolase